MKTAWIFKWVMQESLVHTSLERIVFLKYYQHTMQVNLDNTEKIFATQYDSGFVKLKSRYLNCI